MQNKDQECCEKCHGYFVEPKHEYFPLCGKKDCPCHQPTPPSAYDQTNELSNKTGEAINDFVFAPPSEPKVNRDIRVHFDDGNVAVYPGVEMDTPPVSEEKCFRAGCPNKINSVYVSDHLKKFCSAKCADVVFPSTLPVQVQEDWENKFDRYWKEANEGAGLSERHENIKDFIRQLLTSQALSIRKDERRLIAERVEGMKKKVIAGNWEELNLNEIVFNMSDRTYNLALSEVLNLLAPKDN